MRIEIYSDMVCPYCYVGKLRIDEAIRRTGLENVDVEFRAFQLHPTSPSDRSMPIREFIRMAYGPGAAGNPQIHEQVMSAGRSVGLEFNYDIMRSCNTKKAHRLCAWAAEHGKGTELTIQVMDGYFTKGKELNHDEDLLEMAAAVGLDTAEAAQVLASDRYLAKVDAEIAEAQRLGITSVPFFVIDGRYAISGAQPVELFESALLQAAGKYGM